MEMLFLIAIPVFLALLAAVSYVNNIYALKDRIDILVGRKSPPASKADTDAIAQQIKELEGKVTLGSEYLDGLPEAVNKKLRAAYQEARLLQLEGYEAQSAEKHREAIDRFTRALELAETDSQRAALHDLRGSSYMAISGYDQAEGDFHETLKVADRVSPTRDAAHVRAVALAKLGLVYADRGNLGQAEESHRGALEIDRGIGDRVGEAADLGNLGTVYGRRGDLEKSEEHLGQALRIYESIGDRAGESAALGALALIYRRRGDLDRAEEYHGRAAEILGEIGDRLDEAHELGNLGLVYYERGELDRAEGYYERALETHKQIGNLLGEAANLGNLGLVYYRRGDLVAALGYHERALEIDRRIGNRLGEAHALGNISLVHFQRGEVDKARENLQQAEAAFQEIGAVSELALVRRLLAQRERQQRDEE
jgi:tetratricopeptide (TPR) repeat protein